MHGLSRQSRAYVFGRWCLQFVAAHRAVRWAAISAWRCYNANGSRRTRHFFVKFHGDLSAKLGWRHKTSSDKLVAEMVQADMATVRNERERRNRYA